MAQSKKQPEVTENGTPENVIAEIAKKYLRLETLETRNSDALDFSDQAVRTLRSALEAAYNAGLAARSTK
jgi:hypothetical protein